MTQTRRAAKVSALVRYLKQKLEGDAILHNVLVEGEISNMRRPYTGHWYFSLKDEKSQISAVMFASANRRLKFDPKNGDKVIVKGDVSVYEAGGSMQLIISDISPYGIGDLYRRLELLKEKLYREGWFAEEHKKPLPHFPMSIALVTGNHTAAREDVLITLKKRWPVASVSEYPCPVQGNDAAPRIIEALQKADEGKHDVILLVRGGGSIEDLWCFNDEALAKTIFHLNTPVITGIGHEIDYTLADYTSDRRANTPTGAVEAAVPDMKEVLTALQEEKKQITYLISEKIRHEKKNVHDAAQNAVFLHPEKMWSQQAMELDFCLERILRYQDAVAAKRHALDVGKQDFNSSMMQMIHTVRNTLKSSEMQISACMQGSLKDSEYTLQTAGDRLAETMRTRLEKSFQDMSRHAALLDAYSPLKILSRGYSIVTDHGMTVNSYTQVKAGDLLQIRLHEGRITARAENTEADDGKERNDI